MAGLRTLPQVGGPPAPLKLLRTPGGQLGQGSTSQFPQHASPLALSSLPIRGAMGKDGANGAPLTPVVSWPTQVQLGSAGVPVAEAGDGVLVSRGRPISGPSGSIGLSPGTGRTTQRWQAPEAGPGGATNRSSSSPLVGTDWLGRRQSTAGVFGASSMAVPGPLLLGGAGGITPSSPQVQGPAWGATGAGTATPTAPQMVRPDQRLGASVRCGQLQQAHSVSPSPSLLRQGHLGSKEWQVGRAH